MRDGFMVVWSEADGIKAYGSRLTRSLNRCTQAVAKRVFNSPRITQWSTSLGPEADGDGVLASTAAVHHTAFHSTPANTARINTRLWHRLQP